MIQNLAARFKQTAETCASNNALNYRAGELWGQQTYGELAVNIEKIAVFLLKEGAKEGDKVAILLENGPQWPAIFFAVAYIGAVVVPISSESSQEEIKAILQDSEAAFIFLGKSANGRDIVKTFDIDSEVFQGVLQSEDRIKEPANTDASALAVIVYTSGTTALPKGVMLTHSNLVSNVDALHKQGLVFQTDRIVSILPLHHIYPLTVTMICPLLFGASIVYPGSFRPDVILGAMKDLNPTEFMVTPQILYLFHKKIVGSIGKIPFPLNLLLNSVTDFLYIFRRVTGINLSRGLFFLVHKEFGRKMRFLISGGAKLDTKIELDMVKFGFTVIEGYGLTETSPVLSNNPPKRPKIGSAGVALPGVELKIHGVESSGKGEGEVIARGPNIMSGYYKRSDLTEAVIKDGWFHTGDIGYLDKEGYLFLTGRMKELIVLSSGKKMYPQEIEDVYTQAAPVKQMCVFALSGKQGVKGSNGLWAIVQPDLEYFKKFNEVNLRGVLKERFDNASQSLPSYKRLNGFTITLEDLPNTRLGKIKRYQVLEIYESKVIAERAGVPTEVPELSPEDLALTTSETGKKVLECLEEQSGLNRIMTPTDSLELDLGIDSLGRIELATRLEEAFNIEVTNEVISGAFRIKELILAVEGALKYPKGVPPEERGVAVGPDYWKELLQVPPKKENLEVLELSTGFVASQFRLILTAIDCLIFKVFFRIKEEGAQNVPEEGAYIIYGNHTSFLDGPAVAACLPRRPVFQIFYFVFGPYFFRPFVKSTVLRNLVKMARIIPFDFSTHFLEALRSCYFVLQRGKGLCFFPEGLRSPTGKVGKFKKGFGILAKETGAVLVPVAITGAHEAWSSAAWFPRPYQVKVKFGKPLIVADLEKEGLEMGAKDSYEAICIAARKALIALKGMRDGSADYKVI